MKIAIAGACVVAVVAGALAWYALARPVSATTLAPIAFDLDMRKAGFGASSLEFFTDGAGPKPRLAALLRVLHSRRTAADALPSLPRALVTHLAPVDGEPERSRLLVAAGGRRLYAVPTFTGSVWAVLEPGVSVKHVDQFADDLVWLLLQEEDKGTIAAGLVPNRVTKVEVAIGADRRIAKLGRNGFIYDARGTSAKQISGLYITADGERYWLPLFRKKTP